MRWGVVDLDLDFLRTGVTDGIRQRFPADAVDLVACNWMQRPRPAFDDHAKLDRLGNAELLLHPAEDLLEIAVGSSRRAQAADGVASLVDDACHQREDAIEPRPRR